MKLWVFRFITPTDALSYPCPHSIILDAKHSDLNTSTSLPGLFLLSGRLMQSLLVPMGQDRCTVFVYPGKTVFVLCCTSNPYAAFAAHYPTDEAPFYLQIVRNQETGVLQNTRFGSGTTEPDVLARIRAVAPERLLVALGRGRYSKYISSRLKC